MRPKGFVALVWALSLLVATVVGAEANPCPLRLANVKLLGGSSDASVRVYSFDLYSSTRASFNASLRLKVADQEATPRITIPLFKPSHRDGQEYQVSGRFATLNVPVESVGLDGVNQGSQTVDCGVLWQPAARLDDDAATLVFPNVTVAGSLAKAELELEPYLLEAAFTTKIVPDYPQPEADLGVEGTTIIFLDITQEGMPARVVVGDSSHDIRFDSAAFTAASNSRFHPSRLYGRGKTQAYKLEYVFQADNGGFKLDSHCGVEIVHAFLMGREPTTKSYIYELRFESDSAAVTDLRFTIGEPGKLGSQIEWTAPTWKKQTPPKVPSYESTLNVLVAHSASLVYLTDSARAGAVAHCDLLPLTIGDDTLSRVLQPSAAPSPGADAPVNLVLPARFVKRVVPQFPPDDRSSSVDGEVEVLVDVASDGRPSGASVIDSSGNRELDSLAVKAAFASTYAISGSPTALFLASYKFLMTVPSGPP